MAELLMELSEIPPDLLEYFEPATSAQPDVFRIATEAFPGAHYATFPTELVRRCLLAGCPAKVCAVCGAGWVRISESTRLNGDNPSHNLKLQSEQVFSRGGNQAMYGQIGHFQRQTLGFRPACDCHAASDAGIVLDPFMGSGTVALVARSLGRHYVGCDLSAEYVALARERLRLPFEAHHVPPPDFAPPADKDYGNGEVQLALWSGANGRDAVE